MAKDIIFSIKAREALKKGVDELSNAVKVTLGPKGRNVIIDKSYGSPIVTKDGVTVAKEVELKDPVENMGAQMVKEVASKTSDLAGDGTTTATVLAQAIFSTGLKNVLNISGIELVSVKAYTLTGMNVISEGAVSGNRLNVSDLSNGIYLIEMKDKEGKTVVDKFLKK